MTHRIRFEVRVLGVATAEKWRFEESIPELRRPIRPAALEGDLAATGHRDREGARAVERGRRGEARRHRLLAAAARLRGGEGRAAGGGVEEVRRTNHEP